MKYSLLYYPKDNEYTIIEVNSDFILFLDTAIGEPYWFPNLSYFKDATYSDNRINKPSPKNFYYLDLFNSPVESLLEFETDLHPYDYLHQHYPELFI